MIERLQSAHNSISELEKEQIRLKYDISKISEEIRNLKLNGETDTDKYERIWGSNIELTEKHKANEKRIKNLYSSQEEIQYYENTGYTLFKYYDIIDKQNTDTTNNFVTPTINVATKNRNRKKASQIVPASQSILEAFKLNTKDEDKKKQTTEEPDIYLQVHQLMK
ncbi:MAG: hypothetical protein EBU66_16580 [Bacteroidetes bacterium]|nr:hypothetical protein [Bacteroidota bacterium]